MIFKIGDKVKFLNEVGEGVIVKIKSAIEVEVETEDGFSFPYLTRNLIRLSGETIEDDDSSQNEISEEFRSEAVSSFIDKNEKNRVLLTFIPYDQNLLIAGDLELKITNLMEFPIQFRVLTKVDNGEFKQLAAAALQSKESYFLENVNRDDLSNYLEGYFQMIICNENDSKIFNPVNVSFKVRGSKFYKESSYKNIGFESRQAIVYNLFDQNEASIVDESEYAKKQSESETKVKKAEEQKYKNEILKHAVGEKRAEVDMHIWELEPDYQQLKKEELLSIQMAYLVKCIDSALEHEFEKIVFIHGVGVGRLRKEIRSYLDEKDNISYKDASMQKYGVGATEVHIKY